MLELLINNKKYCKSERKKLRSILYSTFRTSNRVHAQAKVSFFLSPLQYFSSLNWSFLETKISTKLLITHIVLHYRCHTFLISIINHFYMICNYVFCGLGGIAYYTCLQFVK